MKKFLLALCLACGFATVGMGQVVINEIDADTPGVDTEEFIELFGAPNMALTDLAIVGVNGSDDLTYDTLLFDLDGLSLDANGFLLLGNASFGLPAAQTITGSIQNGADALVLFTYVGDAVTDFPVDSAPPTTGILDVYHYGTNDSADAGISALYPTAVYVDEGALGDKDTDSVGRSMDGAGTLVTFDTPTPGTTNNPAVPEPGSLALLGMASLGMMIRRRR